MNLAKLANKTGVPERTIRRMAGEIGGVPVGGRVGYIFPDPVDAEERLFDKLRSRHIKGNERRGRPRKQKTESNPVSNPLA